MFEAFPRRLFTGVLAAQLLFLACNAGELSGSATGVDPYIACARLLAVDTQFEDISKKLPLYDMSAISFNMLADSSLPTAQERKEISAWFEKWEGCWKDSEALHQSQWPPDIFQLFQEENAEIHNIGIDLYKRKITFGEANKRVQDYGARFRERVAAVVKQYQAEIAAQHQAEIAAQRTASEQAEQEAQRKQDAADRATAQQQADELAEKQAAAAERQRRMQLISNFLSGMAQNMRDMAQARAGTVTNCYTSGSNTSCISH